MTSLFRLTILATCATAVMAACRATPTNYHVVTRTTVGSFGDGYLADFLAVDPVTRRLYGFGSAVLDLPTVKVTGQVSVHGDASVYDPISIGHSCWMTLFP